MKITKEWLIEKDACGEGIEWFEIQEETDAIKLIKYAIKEKDVELLSWANWLIVRIMSYKQYVSYAVFAAEQVIGIFELEYPDDKRPRTAIKAAKKCIKNPSDKNKTAAAYAATAAAYAATAATAAAYANAAANAAATAANAAYATAATATDATTYAANAAYATAAYANAAYVRQNLKIKILKYGLKLLEE